MEDRISKMPDLGFDEIETEKIKVAVTMLDCDDGDIIHLLSERGYAIKNENWSK